MTEFWSARRRMACVWLAYGRRMAGAGVGLALGATMSAAQAGAWEEFESRCLVPMENVEPSVTEGLATGSKFDGGRFFENRREGWSLAVGQRDGLSTCTLFVADFHTGALDAGYAAWAKEAVSSGRYAKGDGQSLQSTEWREPRIEVHFRAAEGTVETQVWVAEVDLEA